jgi:hypothetical protein
MGSFMKASPETKDLSRHLPVASILAAQGIAVKDLTPEVTTCPLCRQGSFSIYADPRTVSASRWLYCPSCGFRGDSVEMYGRLHGIDNLREAIYGAVREGVFNAPLSDIPDEAIDSYVANYPLWRRSHDAKWQRMGGLIESLRPEMLRRVQQDHLWGGWTNKYQTRLRRFLGGGTRKELIDLFNDRQLLPKEGFATALAFNFQDVPGRSCAFYFLGTEGQHVLHYLRNSSRTEGGLAMLDALRPWEGTVYAIGSPLIALQLQRRHLADFDEPRKIVAWNESTDAAWGSVTADRVIFWAPELNVEVFSQARKVANGYVATRPLLRATLDNPYDYLADMPTSVVLDLMDRSAQPWAEVFARWITRKDARESDVRAAVARMGLNAHDRQLVLDSTDGYLQTRLRQLIGEPQTTQATLMGGQTVVNKPDGWYVLYPNRGLELVSDATVRITRIRVDTTARRVIWEGVARCQGKEIPFTEDQETIEEAPYKWLQSLLASAGVSATISKRWGSQLPFMARRFSNPKHEELGTRIGVQHDGRIIFPHLIIADGKFHELAQPAADSLPGACVRAPQIRMRSSMDSDTLSHSAYLAGVCVYVSNLLSTLNSASARACVYAGSPGAAGYAALAKLAEAAGMPRHALPLWRKKENDIRPNAHGYPYWVDAPPRQLHDYPAARGDRVFVSTSTLEATALCAAGQWWSVWAPGTRTDAEPFPPFDDVMRYLADLQERDYETEGTGNPYDILADLSRWYSRVLNVENVEERVRRVLHEPVVPGDGFVDLYCHLFQSGLVHLDHRTLGQGAQGVGKTGIVIDDVGEEVYLSREVLASVVAKLRLPTVDILSATDDLISRKCLRKLDLHLEGWVVPKSYWEERALAWRSKFQP